MKDIKRYVCLLMATATVASCFTGCGENGSADVDAAVEVADAGTTAVAESIKGAIDNKPASINANVGITKFKGNKIYYMSFDESYDIGTMCVYDMVTGEEHKLNTIDAGISVNDYTTPQIFLADFYVDADGNVVELINEHRLNVDTFDFKPESITEKEAKKALVEEWGYAEEDLDSLLSEGSELAANYTDSEGKLRYDWIYVACVGYKYGTTETSKLVTYDMTGNAVNTLELGTAEDNGMSNESVVACGMDKDGNRITIGSPLFTNEGSEKITMSVWDAQGTKKAGSDFPGLGFSTKILNSADGTSKLGYYSDNGYTIADYDASNGTVNVVKEIQDYSVGTLKDANTFIYTDGSTLFSCDLTTGENTTLANLAEHGIQQYALQSIGVMEDGTVVGFVMSFSDADQTCTTDIVKF